MMNIVVFDLETKLRPGKPQDIAAGRSDCLWEDKHKMGISVGCAFSWRTGDYTVHLDDNLPDLWKMLHEADMVTGFNIETFDLPLIRAEMANKIGHLVEAQLDPSEGAEQAASLRKAMTEKLDAQYDSIMSKTYDLYHAIKAGAGADTYDKGYRVDDVLRATWGHEAAKTGNGAFAPDLWKEHKLGELISYCVADVARERRLFERAWHSALFRALGHKEGTESFQVERPQIRLGYPPGHVGILPHRMDGDQLPTPEPSAPFMAPPKKPADLASEAI